YRAPTRISAPNAAAGPRTSRNWHRERDMQVGDVVERVAAVMNLEIHMEAIRQMRRLDAVGQAALDRDVAAQRVGRLHQDPRRVAVKSAETVFGRHHRDVELGA